MYSKQEELVLKEWVVNNNLPFGVTKTLYKKPLIFNRVLAVFVCLWRYTPF